MMAHPAMGGAKGRDVRLRVTDTDVEAELRRALQSFTNSPVDPNAPIETRLQQERRWRSADAGTLARIGTLWTKWQLAREERHSDVLNSRPIKALRRAYQAELVVALESRGYAPTRTDALWSARALLVRYGRQVTTRTLENALRRQTHPPGNPGEVLPLSNDWPLASMPDAFGIRPEWSALLHVCSGRAAIPLRPQPRGRGPAGHSTTRKL
jgi:hypothetical protein